MDLSEAISPGYYDAERAGFLLAGLRDLSPGESSTIQHRDGKTYRLDVLTDFDSGIGKWVKADGTHDAGDYHDDIHGTFSWPRASRDTGRSARPVGFDGAARKLDTRGGPVWWQPPADCTPEQVESVQRRVQSFLHDEWGFVGLKVTVSEPCPTCKTCKELGTDALHGIESDSGDDYLRETVAELIGEANV